ncbi:MAG: hypothetical protein NC401_13890 [Ruminococcus sp.]|nr:hypothetical protein [Ruminococcus sp.]
MSDFIKRETVYDLLGGAPKLHIIGDVAWINIMQDLIDEVDKIPAADVRPERHGRCITKYDGLPFCSECSCNDYGGMLEGMAYCPNCGAKMDGEELENG